MSIIDKVHENWLKQADFEGPFTQDLATKRLLDLVRDSKGRRDLAIYGLLFVIPLFGRLDSGCMVIAEHTLGNVYRAAMWINERMDWNLNEGREEMVGYCYLIDERHIGIKENPGRFYGYACPDSSLVDWVIANAGIIIARDPSVRYYGGGGYGIGIGSGDLFGKSTWEEQQEAKNAQAIQGRKLEIGLK